MKKILTLLLMSISCLVMADEFTELAGKLAAQAKSKGANGKTVAVLPFEFIGNNSQSESVTREVQKLIKSAIIDNTSFTLVASEVVDKIEKEVYEKQSSGLTDPKMRARIGKGYGVKAIITGLIKYKPADGSTQIIAEITDTETHEAIATAEVNTEKFSRELDKSVVLKEKSVKAATFSALLPGVGQMYKGSAMRGSLFLAVEGGLIAGALVFNSKSTAAKKDRDAVYANSYNYNNPDAAYNKYDDDVNKNKNIATSFWIGAAVMYLYNVYDGYTLLPDGFKLEADSGSDYGKLQLCYEF